jgi:hypothetical protein
MHCDPTVRLRLKLPSLGRSSENELQDSWLYLDAQRLFATTASIAEKVPSRREGDRAGETARPPILRNAAGCRLIVLLLQPQRRERPAIRDRDSRNTGCEFDRTGRALNWVSQADFLAKVT